MSWSLIGVKELRREKERERTRKMTYKQTHMIFEHLKYFRTVFVLRKKPIRCEIMNCNDQLL